MLGYISCCIHPAIVCLHIMLHTSCNCLFTYHATYTLQLLVYISCYMYTMQLFVYISCYIHPVIVCLHIMLPIYICYIHPVIVCLHIMLHTPCNCLFTYHATYPVIGVYTSCYIPYNCLFTYHATYTLLIVCLQSCNCLFTYHATYTL